MHISAYFYIKDDKFMHVSLICMGKTNIPYIKEGILDYSGRVGRVVQFDLIEIPELKNTSSLSPGQVKEKESEILLKKIPGQAFTVLLDEKGVSFRSVEFAKWIQGRFNQGIKDLVFVIGGAYGFHEEIRAKANYQLSLSTMTFSHQIVRIIFMEQLYRALSIIRNEPYHNE